ncbi:ParB N-terminal domain-containing protein [Streptomyces sp. H27-H1]|uniref:ParB/RepB/Spo0J family partition protein n=1 Tax=unclassified Streptomyces TaxID=2593676 RepID=UPI00226D54A3|nr:MULTISPECIES: ParB N-terminal domain-containing protein [unclassified Streptomyces]MCY0929459.1 ParB N-terminal domain-containing protein [Streptomyces sp. H27-H1]MCY0938325.1 ParB N-terminal domain-containing protein [Streptomyces sp. H34-S4]
MSTASPRIPTSLADLTVSLADLAPYHRNPRTGDLDAIAESLATHGQYKPIVVNRGTHTGRPNEILAGNHTAKAARKLGWDEIAVTWLDVDEATAAKIVIVDNRTSDLAGYDTALLADILTNLPDLEGTGYDQEQLDDLLDDTSLPAPIELPSDGAGTGAAATVDYLQWGYLQWSSTRVRITQDEVEFLNAIYKRYVDEQDTDLGFGWHVLNEEHHASEEATA